MNLSSTSPFLLWTMTVISFLIALTAVMFLVMTARHYRRELSQTRKKEQRLDTIIKTAVIGIVTTDEKGTILEFNRSAEEIFGWKREEIVGQSIKTLMPEPYHNAHDHYIQSYLGTGEAKIIGSGRNLTGLHKDGSVIPIRLALSHARLPGESFFVGMLVDITERLEMEHALHDRERQFRSLISNIPGLTYRALPDAYRTAMFISDAAENVTGYSSSDFIGPHTRLKYGDVIHPNDVDRVLKTVSEAIENKSSFDVEYRTFHRDGSLRWMWERGTPLLSDDGEVQAVDGIIIDTTERREMEEALRKAKESAEQAVAARSAFLATISHEIRTPMNAIIGFTDVLLTSKLDSEQRRRLTIVHESARSLLHLLNDVLDSAKLGRGAVELEILDFDLPYLLSQIDAGMGAQARAKGLAFHLRLAPSLATYYRGDPSRIRQILTNLIGNAIKFTEHGSITVYVTPNDEGVHFHVEDTGIGIPPDRLNKIFDPFTQANASMSRRFGGTGLGTSISKQLVELMGGRIWVESTPEAGSTFHFILPLMPGETVQHKSRKKVILPPQSILAIDDVPQNVELIQTLLQRANHKVATSTNAAEAIRIAENGCFDLILMDLHMPEMDGLKAARHIRRTEQQSGRPPTPIIALTASVFEDDRVAAMAAGMNGFAAKPIDLEDLFAEMANVLGFSVDNSFQTKKSASSSTLDIERALSLWGNLTSYNRALRHFINDSETFPKTFRQFIEHNNFDAARNLVHRHRGVAANLGAGRLAQALGAIELQLRAGEKTFLSTRMTEIENLLHELGRESIALEKKDTESTAKIKVDLAPSDMLHILQRLQKELQRGAIDEISLEQIHTALIGSEQELMLEQIEQHISAFDFDAAVEDINKLLMRFEEPQGKA